MKTDAALVLFVIGAVVAVVQLIRTQARDLDAWGVLAVSVGLLLLQLA